MFGELKAGLRKLLLYVLSVMPKENSLEFIRGRGIDADCNISVDAFNTGFGIYYNTQITKDYEVLIEKGGINAASIEFFSPSKHFYFNFADGTNRNEGDWADWLTPLSIWGRNLDFNNPDLRVGIGGVIYPEANLHVVGKVRIDDDISSSANAGSVSVPSACVGFLTVNINGRNYKIPLYNE
ncbi:MAG: hypothetical protein GXO22_07300 [Aquificae bacterium]|nr:hypothetical protein [Aquificota bacterium]